MSDVDHNIPDPDIRFRGSRQRRTSGLLEQAGKWSFPGMLIIRLCSVSLYASRLIDRRTGKAFSADELATAADSPVKIAIESAIDGIEGGGEVDWAAVTAATGSDAATGSGRFAFNLGVSGLATRNSLGVGAVDLQTSWALATQTASGAFSFVAGAANRASGTSSVAMGTGSSATGNTSIAIGSSCSASSTSAVALGSSNTSSGATSFTAGSSNTASSSSAIAIGSQNTASGASAVAAGNACTASGQSSVALGDQCEATALRSHASGFAASATHAGSRVYTDDSSGMASSQTREFACKYANGYRMTGGPFRVAVTTVSALPSAASFPYYEAWVSDAELPVVGATVVGGDSTKAKVASNGTNWIVTAVI